MKQTAPILLLLVLLIAFLPSWRHSRRWGYIPSGLVGLGLILVIILVATGRL